MAIAISQAEIKQKQIARFGLAHDANNLNISSDYCAVAVVNLSVATFSWLGAKTLVESGPGRYHCHARDFDCHGLACTVAAAPDAVTITPAIVEPPCSL